MENQVKSITRELNIFPEFMGRSKHEVWRELHQTNIEDTPCLEHTAGVEGVIIIRPDKTSPLYEEVRKKWVTIICPKCGWEICHK